MMDVNEAIMELEFDPNPEKLQKLKAEVNIIEQEINQKLNQQTIAFDQSIENSDQILKNIKDLYYRSKYLDRIKENIGKLSA
jgi:molecular chaperone HscB